MKRVVMIIALYAILVFSHCVFGDELLDSLSNMETRSAKITHDVKVPVHQYIAREAWKIHQWTELFYDMAEYIGEVQYYNESTDDDGYYLCEGAEEEDQWGDSGTSIFEPPDPPGLHEATYFTHFWNPNGGYSDGLSYSFELSYLSAIEKAVYYWKEYAIPKYQGGDKSKSYYWLGHIAHLLTDMSVPAHVHEDIHAIILEVDSYEDYMKAKTHNHDGNYKQWDYKGLTAIDYDTLSLSPDPNHCNYDNFAYYVNDINSWDEVALFKLFVNLAEEADNYDSNDVDGERDMGQRRAWSLWDLCFMSSDECREIGNTLMPLSMRYVAGLYQLFWDKINENTFIMEQQFNEEYVLFQNYPNPFNPSTTISFKTASNVSNISLTIYNITGQKIRVLIDNDKVAGFNSIIWDSRDYEGHEVPCGVYFYQLECGSICKTEKMLLIK